MNLELLDLPDLVLETICFWAADWRALRCCKKLEEICWRWIVLSQISLRRGTFCWRQRKFLHELSSCKFYNIDGRLHWPVVEANYILGHMYFIDNDYANAWAMLDYYFCAGGKPYLWLSKGICIIGTSDKKVDNKWIRAIFYIHIDICQHIRAALSVIDMDAWQLIESSSLDALKVSIFMRLGVPLPGVKFPLDAKDVSIADTVCNSNRVDVDNEYSLTIEENIGALAILENWIQPMSWSIMEVFDSVRRVSLARSV